MRKNAHRLATSACYQLGNTWRMREVAFILFVGYSQKLKAGLVKQPITVQFCFFRSILFQRGAEKAERTCRFSRGFRIPDIWCSSHYRRETGLTTHCNRISLIVSSPVRCVNIQHENVLLSWASPLKATVPVSRERSQHCLRHREYLPASLLSGGSNQSVVAITLAYLVTSVRNSHEKWK